MCIAPLILKLETRWRWLVNFTPLPLYSREEPRYPLNRKLGRHQSLSGRFWKRENLLHVPGFEPRNIQPAGSRFIDYTIPASIIVFLSLLLLFFHRDYNDCVMRTHTHTEWSHKINRLSHGTTVKFHSKCHKKPLDDLHNLLSLFMLYVQKSFKLPRIRPVKAEVRLPKVSHTIRIHSG